MAHYRMYKLRESRGGIIKAKDIEAASHGEAMKVAEADPDCPICEVWRGSTPVGKIEAAK